MTFSREQLLAQLQGKEAVMGRKEKMKELTAKGLGAAKGIGEYVRGTLPPTTRRFEKEIDTRILNDASLEAKVEFLYDLLNVTDMEGLDDVLMERTGEIFHATKDHEEAILLAEKAARKERRKQMLASARAQLTGSVPYFDRQIIKKEIKELEEEEVNEQKEEPKAKVEASDKPVQRVAFDK